MSGLDEFGEIERLFRPLTRGDPAALDLMDDAASIPSRPGFDLVVTKDAIVEGVHFLSDLPAEIVAKKLLRANLSDLAAKAAEPYGYFLMTAWPRSFDAGRRAAFARGLDEDGAGFGVVLLGGDTVATDGPLVVSMTMLGWVPAGRMVRRRGARPGDLVLVSGPIGNGWLEWGAARGLIEGRPLGAPWRLPEPRLDLREALRAQASAAADVSDGLVADAGHIGEASGLGVTLDLDRMPLSGAGVRWLDAQPDRTAALVRLATGGDDYEVVCTADGPIAGMTIVGAVAKGAGVTVTVDGAAIDPGPGGWRHG